MAASIQSSVNSTIGSIGSTVHTIKKSYADEAKSRAKAAAVKQTRTSMPQARASYIAKQNAQAEIQAKTTQRRNFMEYLKKQPTGLGVKVGELDPNLQKQIASKYTPSMRKKLMDAADKEANRGKH